MYYITEKVYINAVIIKGVWCRHRINNDMRQNLWECLVRIKIISN